MVIEIINGLRGLLLKINLSKGEISTEPLNENYAKNVPKITNFFRVFDIFSPILSKREDHYH